ncbi:MAG TPA: insulinase family protein, partial [Hydrogenophilus thermoluteolus]|nr:insulinase family protein [Hydrogenophilus thermoluteolus]
GPGIFALDAQAAPGVSPDRLAAALYEAVQRVAREGVTPAELERVLRQYEAQQVYQRDSLMGQAMRIGMARAVGLPFDAEVRFLRLLQTVTPAEVQQAAQRWFDPTTMTRVDVLPQRATQESEEERTQ